MKFEIKELPIDEIKADKGQPRKTFDDDSLQELSESILSNGLIEPIEVDENHIIIDGERRWRAHKLANLKTISCKIFKIGNNLQQRRIMQLMNDIQKEEIPTKERYQALWELYEIEYPKESKEFQCVNRTQGGGGHGYKIQEFAHSIGKDHSYIVRAFDYLELAKEEPELVEGLAPSLVGETKKLPKEERKEILKEMKEGGVVKTIDQIREAVKQKKENIEMKKALEEIKKTKDMSVKITNTEEQLDELKEKISSEIHQIGKVLGYFRTIRRTKLYVKSAKYKENFFKYLDGQIERLESHISDLKHLKENLELEIAKE